MKEREDSGSINVRKFYRRRILRTWPLYYLVLIVGLVLLMSFPNANGGLGQHPAVVIVAFSLLVPNIVAWVGYAPDLISVLWSVGAEEQFYAIWPLLVRNTRNLLWRLSLLLILWLVIRQASVAVNLPGRVWSLMQYMPFDYILIGGIAACWYKAGSKVLSIVYHPLVQVLCWLFFAVSVFYHPVRLPGFGLLNIDLHALVYAGIILNVSTNKGSLIKLENKVLDFLGRISYGIYGYHFIVLFLLSLCFKAIMVDISPHAAYALMFIAELSVTILVAYMSHRYVESWFLRKKI